MLSSALQQVAVNSWASRSNEIPYLMTITVSLGNHGSKAEEDHDPEMPALISAFKAKLPDRLKQIDSAVDAGDWELVSMLAHRLRGARMFDCEPLGDVADRLQSAVEQGEHQRASMLIDQLRTFTLAENTNT